MAEAPELRFAAADLALLGVWLREPHVARWFAHADEWLDEIGANLDAAWVAYARVERDGMPLGFAQADLTERAPHGAWSGQPPGTRGIDFLLGRPQDLARGLGHALVAQCRRAASSASARGARWPTRRPATSLRAGRCAAAASSRMRAAGCSCARPGGTRCGSPGDAMRTSPGRGRRDAAEVGGRPTAGTLRVGA